MKKFAKRAISLLCAMALAVGCAGGGLRWLQRRTKNS